MLKWLRKYNTFILVVGGCLLMVAFLLQGVVLIGLMIALRPVGLPAEIKALAVAGLGVAGSFGLAWLLVARTPLGRTL